jgi:hypothetical protein
MSRSPGRLLIISMVTIALASWSVPAAGRKSSQSELQPIEVARALIGLGSREMGSEANAEAADLLKTALSDLGWDTTSQETASTNAFFETLSSSTPGEVNSEVVISAHFDSAAGSPGALDNASGCGVVLSSFADLARSPHYRHLRLVFFDGEESQMEGSADWVEDRSQSRLPSVFAAITAEMVGSSRASIGVVHPGTAGPDGRWTVTPVWLMHAALEGANAVGFPVLVSDVDWPIFAQLSLRIARPTKVSDSRSFLEAGIPALTISDISLTESDRDHHSSRDTLDRLDAERLQHWASALSAMVLQVDYVRGSPLVDTEYLVAAGRVWIRRDLLWVGFALWVPLVFQGLPGRWRGASADSKRRRGRKYLPGFAFRMLFLVSLFLIPTIATVLLYPVALVALIPTARGSRVRSLVGGLAFLPLLSFTIWIAIAQLGGHLVLHRGALAPLALVLLTLVSFWIWRVDGH